MFYDLRLRHSAYAAVTHGGRTAQSDHGPRVQHTEADAVMASLQIFPADNPWNTKIIDWPVAKNSKAIIDSIGASKPLR